MSRRVYAPLQLINKRPYGKVLRAIVERRTKDVMSEMRRHGAIDVTDVERRGGAAIVSAVANAAYGRDTSSRDAIAFFDEMLAIMPLYAFAEHGSRIASA